MTAIVRHACRLLAVMLLVIVSAERHVRAQAGGAPDDEVAVDEQVQAQAQPQADAAELLVDVVDQKSSYKNQLALWVAGQPGTGTGLRVQLENELKSALTTLAAECHPADSLLKKLELAGRGDIKRLIDRLDQLGHDFDRAGSHGDQLEMIELEVRKAKNRVALGFFDADSLYFKTMAKIGLRYPVSVARAVRELARNIDLIDRQRVELVELIVRETLPPLRFGKASDLALVLCQASRIPADKFARVLSAAQTGELLRWIAVYKEGAGSEAVLRRNGFVFAGGPVMSRHQAAKRVAGQAALVEIESGKPK